MARNPLWKDREETAYGSRVADLVNVLGAKRIVELAETAEAERKALMDAVKLPEHFRFFDEMDWMGFAGASNTPNGMEPVSGYVKFALDVQADLAEMQEEGEPVNLGDNQDVQVIIGYDDGASEYGFIIELYLPGSVTYSKRLKSNTLDYSEALAPFHLLAQASRQPTSLSVFIAAFGFTRSN